MQCQSYLPLYYACNDLNMDANGSTRPVYTGHVTPPTGHYSQRFLNSHVAEGYHRIGYDKEFLRQTILQQEVTFKDQVQELHRLYTRQRELLDEVKRNSFYKKIVLSEAQWSPNSLTSHVSFSSDQKEARSTPFDSLAFIHPSTSGASFVQRTPWTATKGESIRTPSHVSGNVRSSNILDLSLSQSNVAQRKPLDLQLPADEYISNEEKGSLNNFEVSGLSIWSTHTSNRACPLAPPANMKPLFVSNSPTTFSSQMIDLEKFSGSKHMFNGTLDDCPDKKKLKMCNDIIEAGKRRSSLNSSSWYSYSESWQRLAEAHQTAPLFTKKDGSVENGRRNTDAKILGSTHEMLNLNTAGQVGASHRPILEFPAAHSGKMDARVPLTSSCGQAPCVDELDYSSRCSTILEPGRSLQVSCSGSNVKASSASSSFLFQNHKCDLASADNERAKHTNRLGSIDLNCTGAADLEGFSDISVFSREKADGLTSPELVSSQAFPSSSVLKDNRTGSCEETTLLSSTNVDQENIGQRKKSCLFDINLPCHLTTDMERLEDDQQHADPINMDSNVKNDQLSPSSASSKQLAEVDLEAPMIPVSPEKQESRRPRGESEENKTETSLQLSTREDGELMDDLMKVAADVLVSISSSEDQQNSTDSEQCQPSNNELLIWFSGVICPMEQGEEFTASNKEKGTEKCEKVSSSTGIVDYFEAMTLKLTETSEEDYWSNTTTLYNEKEMSDAPFCVESSRGGRTTKRVKRKNFQREVLPSLASLSRYEVSEDIQIIEVLMEAAGTPLQMGVKTRKLSKKGRLRGRKKMHTTTTAESSLESRTCLLALPYMAIRAVDLKDKGRVRWENMPRRPRGKRCRTVFPNITLSQEVWMRKWGGIAFAQKGKRKLRQVEMLVPQAGCS